MVGMPADRSQDIRDRTFRFACAVAELALKLAPSPGVRCIIDQLVRAGTGVGSNLEEAKAGSSKREFLKYVQMCGEAEQISRVLGAITVNAKRRMIAGYAVFAFCILNFALLVS